MVKNKSKRLSLLNSKFIIALITFVLLFFGMLLFFFVSAQIGGYGYLIEIQMPENGSIELDGNISFSYEFSNSSYPMDNCSLIFNGAINQTLTNINSSSTNYFSLNNVPDGDYSWSVNCSWPDGNISESESRILTVFNDVTPPSISIQAPSNGTSSTNRLMEFNYSVNDDGWIVNCSIYTDIGGTWRVNQTNYFVIKNISQTFELNDIPDDTLFTWNIVCYDFAYSPNSAWATVNRTVTIQNPAPLLSGIPSQTWGEDLPKTLNLSSYASDPDNDELNYNSSSPAHISVELDENSGMVILTPQNNWFGSEYINFYVYDSDGDVNSSEVLLTVTEEGDTNPRFIDIDPINNYDGDGYLFLTPNVTDDSALVNISLYSNTGGSWQLKETKGLTGTANSTTFVLSNISEGNYTYAFLISDNSSQATWSENRTIEVNIDVALEHDISSYTVNHIDHNGTIIASYSSYLNDSIVLGNLNIYLSNGSLYFTKNLSGTGFDVNFTNPPLTAYVEKIRIRYDEIFYGDFTVGNEEWINISLDYNYLGNQRRISTIHTIEVVE